MAEGGEYKIQAFEELYANGNIDMDGIVDMEKISNSSMKTGYGSIENGDVYVVRPLDSQNTDDYYLFYYDDKKEWYNIGKLFESKEDYFTYSFNDETKTATITGVKDKYRRGWYYKNSSFSKSGVTGIIDNGVTITELVIPEKVRILGETYTVTEIRNYCFAGADAQGESYVGDFESQFTKIVIPNSIERIGDHAFELCKATTIEIGSGVKYIGSYAFWECSNAKLSIPANIQEIGISAFWGDNLGETITIPESCVSIGANAFGGGSSVKEVRVKKAEGSISGAPWGAYKAKVIWNYTN